MVSFFMYFAKYETPCYTPLLYIVLVRLFITQ